jgi:protein-S-isoprenylcysteine O-methyltransferase Ste14
VRFVAAQTVLLAAVLAAPRGRALAPRFGAALLAGGGALAAGGLASLGRSLSPFPEPREDAELVEHGAYGLVRHPIYGGLLLAATGWSLRRSPRALVPTALLTALWSAKARREEELLRARFPRYREYAARTPRRFIPGPSAAGRAA